MVKALGIYFGKNEDQENHKQIIEKIKKSIDTWALTPLSIMERAQVAKTFLYSNINYILKTTDMENKVIEKIANEIKKYIWGYKTHYVQKDTLYMQKNKEGG